MDPHKEASLQRRWRKAKQAVREAAEEVARLERGNEEPALASEREGVRGNTPLELASRALKCAQLYEERARREMFGGSPPSDESP